MRMKKIVTLFVTRCLPKLLKENKNDKSFSQEHKKRETHIFDAVCKFMFLNFDALNFLSSFYNLFLFCSFEIIILLNQNYMFLSRNYKGKFVKIGGRNRNRKISFPHKINNKLIKELHSKKGFRYQSLNNQILP